jgi:hypothetical protein
VAEEGSSGAALEACGRDRHEAKEEGQPEEPFYQIRSRAKFINGEHLRLGASVGVGVGVASKV